MWLLTNWRFCLAVAFLALLPITYGKGRHDGRKLERLENARLLAQANEQAREVEKLRQRSVDAAVDAAAAREAAIRADAASAARAADGLRSTLDAVQQASRQSADAAAKSVAALADVFQQCTAEYRALAEVADRHANDSLKLQQGWPK